MISGLNLTLALLDMGITVGGDANIGVDVTFLDEANGLVEQTKFLLERMNKSKNTLQKSTTKISEISEKAREKEKLLRVVVDQLRHYINYGMGKQDSSKVNDWIQEAHSSVDEMKQRGIYIEKRYNRGSTDFELVTVKCHPYFVHFFFAGILKGKFCPRYLKTHDNMLVLKSIYIKLYISGNLKI